MSNTLTLSSELEPDIDIDFTDLGRAEILLRRGGEALVRLVDRLGPLIGPQFCEILEMEPDEHRKNIAQPLSWRGGTPYFYARSVLDAKTAYEAQDGRVLSSILNLAPEQEVLNISRYFRNGINSGQNSSRVLRGVRPLIRLLGGDFSRRSRKMIRKLSKTDRRGEDEQLPTKEECLQAALEEFRDGLLMIEAGQKKRGKTRIRDAVAMAVEICVALRRSEFTALTIEMILIDANNVLVKILIPEIASKVREVQLGLIRDERAIRMLLHLIADKTSGSVFNTNWHKGLSGSELYRALSRASNKSTLNLSLNFNKSRRIAVTSEIFFERQQERVRHTPGSSVTKDYQKHDDDIGLAEVRAVIDQHVADCQPKPRPHRECVRRSRIKPIGERPR